MSRLLTIAASLVLAVSTESFAQNWPQFRGPDGGGIADRQNLPVNWDVAGGENLLWRTPVPGLAHSSPVVWGDRIYLTTSVAEMNEDPTLRLGDSDAAGIDTAPDLVFHRWEILALDKRTGGIVWQKTAHRGVPRLKRHGKASHASATPATDGRHLVALLGTEGLYCFGMDGDLHWRVDVGLLDVGYWGQPDYQWGAASSPLIYRDLVFVQNDRQKDSFVAAYDLETGKEVWRAARDEKPAWSTPAIYRGETGVELVTNGANWIRANDPTTGAELWRLSHGDLQVITPTPLVAGDRIVVTGGNPTGAQTTFAIRPGARGDAASHVLWEAERSSPYTPTPLAYQGILYVIVDNGILSAYDLETGERVYRRRLEVGAGFSASPVASDGKIYLPSEDGAVFVVRAGRELETLARNEMGEPLMASPAVSDGILLVRGRRHLFAISAR
ncbi:MAG: PQQ-binding-like beta-propeller repeat protein [Vicinamibacteria bacterium]